MGKIIGLIIVSPFLLAFYYLVEIISLFIPLLQVAILMILLNPYACLIINPIIWLLRLCGADIDYIEFVVNTKHNIIVLFFINVTLFVWPPIYNVYLFWANGDININLLEALTNQDEFYE